MIPIDNRYYEQTLRFPALSKLGVQTAYNHYKDGILLFNGEKKIVKQIKYKLKG